MKRAASSRPFRSGRSIADGHGATLNIEGSWVANRGSSPDDCMEQHFDFSAVAVTFQALGALLFAIVMTQLARIFAFGWVRLWAVAWGALSFALAEADPVKPPDGERMLLFQSIHERLDAN